MRHIDTMRRDDLDPARGIVFACAASLVLWAALGAIVWILTA